MDTKKETKEDTNPITVDEKGTTMNLRRFRKATAKKRQLLAKAANNNKDSTDIIEGGGQNNGLQKRRKKAAAKKQNPITAETNNCVIAIDDEDTKMTSSESNTMTLEQFTDIVLASEGMTSLKAANNNKANTIMETNNNDEEKNAMVATILQNKDLTVEVKSAKSKPVVLSPRQPENGLFVGGGHHGHHHFLGPGQGNSVVVSVKPRVSLPPVTTQPCGPKLVEEWLKKMPIDNDVKGQVADVQENLALNLSVKAAKDLVSITSPQYFHLKPNNMLMSPPRLEIKRVTTSVAGCSPSTSGGGGGGSGGSGLKNLVVGRALPFPVSGDDVKARAIRDVQLAHTKDMHGNFPLHMSVLMRKPELVKRYCCVLQILDSSLDLINDEKLTPLHLAVRDNSVEIIEMLLAFGANTTIKDIRGNTGLHMATATRSSECLKILAENSSKDDLNVHNNFGITPLHIAMMNDDTACMDILLRYGANPKILDDLTKLNPTSSSPKDVKNNIVHNTVNSQKNVFIH